MAGKEREFAIGIDLGTTFSVVAYLDETGRPCTLLNAEGDLTTPSVVYFDKAGAVVGKEAVKVAEYEPERIAQFAKRDMGKKYYHKPIRGERLPPEVIQALILRKLREDAELKLGCARKAVITVPAYFTEPMRKSTMDAGRLAGIDVLDIINEPTAAAICYGVQQGFLNARGEASERELILVYDLGGGTFDATLMEVHGTQFNAIATVGDVYLGGIDWDRRIVDYLAEQFIADHGVDPREDEGALQAMLHEAEDAKRALTARSEVMLHFAWEGMRTRTRLTREQFEEMTADLLDRTLFTIRKLLRETNHSWNDITRLMLVGGSTRMPMIHRMLEQESGLKVDRSLSPDEAVAHGAALYAGFLLGDEAAKRRGLSIQNVSSHDLGVLGIESSTGMKRRQVMIPRNTPLPAKAVKRFKTYKPGQRSVAVNVIEGGDASGNNATAIGRCVVSGLPPDLPAKTPVEVIFEYATNGRLKVSCRLPSLDKKADLVIERAGGLTEEELQYWAERVGTGLPDASVGQTAPPAATAVGGEKVVSRQPAAATETGDNGKRTVAASSRGAQPAQAVSRPTEGAGQAAKTRRHADTQQGAAATVAAAVAQAEAQAEPAGARTRRMPEEPIAPEPTQRAQAAIADTDLPDGVSTTLEAVEPPEAEAVDATAADVPDTPVMAGSTDEGDAPVAVATVVEENEPPVAEATAVVSEAGEDEGGSLSAATTIAGRDPDESPIPADADPVPEFMTRSERRAERSAGKAARRRPREAGKRPGEFGKSPSVPAQAVAEFEPEPQAVAVAVGLEPPPEEDEELDIDPEIAAQIPVEEDDLLLLEREKTPEQIWKERVDAAKVFAINTLLHAAVLLIFAFIVLPEQTRETFRMITSSMEEDIEEVIEQEDLTIEEPEEISELPPAEIVNDLITDSPDNVNLDISDFEPSMDLPDTLSDAPGLNAPIKGEMAGRSKAGRSALVAKYGGTAESEAAVERGIKWLIRHQLPDGSWSYDHRVQGCGTVCDHPGTLKNSHMGATAMAVLAALGAGHTHVSGDYQPAIKKAIGYLLANAKRVGAGLDMRGANESNSGMYIQGLVATALAECYNMSKYVLEENKDARDSKARAQRRAAYQATKTLKEAAEGSVLFIINAQDPVGGGWRYKPRQAGDTSVVGWQVMALVSAKYADIPVPSGTIMGVNRFLNFVQADNGAQYGYTGPAVGRHSTTAIGLLCRIYLGWRRENDALRRGVEFLSKKGPSNTDMYYNYYATQVMHQYGGEPWKKWNAKMRDYLVKTQDKSGHAAGSWGFVGPHGDKGGRLMTTTLAIMTLEVYYRHMPLYQHELESDQPKSKTAKRSK